MKKLCFTVCLLVLAIRVPLAGQDTMDYPGGNPDPVYRSRVSLWGGYTTVGMSEVNDTLNAAAGGGSVTGVNSGYGIAGDFLYSVAPRLYIGARIEYVGANRGKASTPASDIEQDLYLVPIMAGGRYYFRDICCPVNISVGAFGGVGLGYGSTKAAGTTTKYDGSAFAGEVLVGGEYQLSEPVSLGLDIGYRYAPLSSMSTSTGGGGGDAGGGGGGGGGYAPNARRAAIPDASGGSLAFDFSGMFVNLGISFRY